MITKFYVEPKYSPLSTETNKKNIFFIVPSKVACFMMKNKRLCMCLCQTESVLVS